jgi:asparagine synthase (glutamine-hydrolysing)
MCGIAGIIALDGFEPSDLVSMTHQVSYRGPDGFGFAYFDAAGQEAEVFHGDNRPPRFAGPVVGLGNRRLAIVDLSEAANMPMTSSDGSCSITYNGEIYNYKEIRAELEAKGRRFQTQTDTEVILEAYLEWGEACLERFNGMWSFGLWDRRERTLFCARDRFGVKPFYYAKDDRTFIFGSEIKQVLSGSKMRRVANCRTVFHFLDRGLIDHSSETFFEDVHQLRGGHCLTMQLDNFQSPRVKQFWNLNIQPLPERTSDAELIHEFRTRFNDAVALRHRSDVPVGACLSGGLDSSSVVCQSRRLNGDRQLHTFSACFREAELDEREFIAQVAPTNDGSAHWMFPCKEDFWRTIDRIFYHLDEPASSTNTFAQWSVMESARENKTPVLLGGQGADEALCGYQKYRYFHLWRLLQTKDVRVFREAALWLRNGTRSYWTLADAANYIPKRFRQPFSALKRLCSADFRSTCREPAFEFGAGESLADRQRIDLSYTSLPALLHHEDRNSMAHSIETRLPFLDYRLVEFAVNCPDSLKLRDGWSKWILRQALKGTLPEGIRLRKTKLGFDTPQESWTRYGLANGHRHLWAGSGLKMERFLSGEKLAREVPRFLRGEAQALPACALFRAASLELWARVHEVH